MSDLEFVPHYHPYGDFLITKRDSPAVQELLVGLGATRVARVGYTAYVWSTRLGDRFVVGTGVLGGRFVRGPRQLSSTPTSFGVGNYAYVELGRSSATVQPDPFGMAPVYTSEDFVTNRLHLASLVTRRIDRGSALSLFFNEGGMSFSLNTYSTPVAGTSLVAVGHSVVLDGSGIRLVADPAFEDFDEREPGEYWELIEAGAAEVVETVSAIVDSGYTIFADITGGRDSRVVFAALVAGGHMDRVVFNTIPRDDTPGLRADLEIGSGLVAAYGGSYDDRPHLVAHAVHPIETHLKRRRSHNFGTYHWIQPADVRPNISIGEGQTIRLLGGGGELYREYWKPLLFRAADSAAPADVGMYRELLYEYCSPQLGRTHFESYSRAMLDTFDNLPGLTLGHRMDAHYLNFRNRFHFGLRQSSPETISTLNVATSPKLLTAARSLPTLERASARVLFDVVRSIDARLANLPYDSPNHPDIKASRYHWPSQFDSSQLSLEPAPDIVRAGLAHRRAGSAAMPPMESFVFEEVLDAEIDQSLELLSSEVSCFADVVTEELRSRIAWARDYSPRNRSAYASKLRALTDYVST